MNAKENYKILKNILFDKNGLNTIQMPHAGKAILQLDIICMMGIMALCLLIIRSSFSFRNIFMLNRVQ